MATKKKAAKKKSAKKSAKKRATRQGGLSLSNRLNQILRFRKEWFTDPAPELRKQLSSDALRALDAAKRDFTDRVNTILNRG
ncbi:MAG: hypothetical protein ABI596_07425 [Pyrinomonadaceae bacterium]